MIRIREATTNAQAKVEPGSIIHFSKGWACRDWISADDAANSGGADQVALYLAGEVQTCTATILGAINGQFGTDLSSANVTGNFFWGGAVNIDISASNLASSQYNSIHAGRYAPSGFWAG